MNRTQMLQGQPAMGAPGQKAGLPPGAPGGLVMPGGTWDNPLAIGGSAVPPAVTLPLSHVRHVSAQNLEFGNRTMAPVTVVAEVDCSRLKALYERSKPQFQAHTGVPLTYTPFFARATVKALQAYPIMNAMLTPRERVIPRFIHLGFAAQTADGVLIPTIRNAEAKGIEALARDVHNLSQRARTGQLTPPELSGQTFVMTNTGTLGKTLFGTPTIMPPNAGILAFEAIQKRPVVGENDQIFARPMMYMALTADHRVVDGADMIGFITKVKEGLETLDL